MRRLPFATSPSLPSAILAVPVSAALAVAMTGAGPAGTVAASTPTNPTGSWGALTGWPMVTVHSILLTTGKVLQFDGWQNPEPTQVRDPASKTFNNIVPASSIFCSGNATLADGRVLTSG